MDIREIAINLICLHITGGLFWFVFITWISIKQGDFQRIFLEAQGNAKLSERIQNKIRIALLFTSLVTCLMYWEISCFNTVRKSYKNFLPQRSKDDTK